MAPGVAYDSTSRSKDEPTGSSSSSSASSNQTTRDDCVASRKPSTSYRARPVSVSDDDLVARAAAAKTETDWEHILLSARAGPGRWKQHHAARDFAVYTRQESHRFGVLAVGLVRGGAGEIMNVLQCATSAQYAQQMAAVFQEQFKDGCFVYHVPPRRGPRERSKDPPVQLVDLSVKTVTFHKAGWLGAHEEWCYLDAVYRHGATGAAEKLMTTLGPATIVAGLSSAKTKHLHGIMCAYLLLPEASNASMMPAATTATTAMSATNQDDNDEDETKPRHTDRDDGAANKATRVHFYSEFLVPKHVARAVASLAPSASDKTVKRRLLRLADSCARLDVLVRRQRLGVQDVVDYTRVLPPTNTPCMVCTKMLLVARVCRLCGMGVCADCSAKHERAVLPPGVGGRAAAVRVELIRVCATCMYRVDRACYDNLTPASLQGPRIVPDPVDATSPAAALRELLHDALVTAPSPSRKAGVMNVIKCVLDQELGKCSSLSAAASVAPPQLTPTSSEKDYLDALEYLEVEHLPAERATCRTHEERCYRVDASGPDAALNAPLAECEEERLRAVAQLDLDELADSVELNLLCHLAAKEMGCSTSTIAIFDRDHLNCVAANIDAYARLKLPRWNTMCAHTILDRRPHLIPHPEADIRMADALVVTGYGVRFYFAFPVVDESDQIIGSYCVMNEQSREITAAQYSAFRKLSETCNKVIKLHVETRSRRKSSTVSSASTLGSTTEPAAIGQINVGAAGAQ